MLNHKTKNLLVLRKGKIEMDSNEVYYKIYYLDREDHVTVVCMQWFDEGDYHERHFFKDEEGDVLKFDNETDAIQWILDNVADDKIDPEYKEYEQNEGFNQKKFMKNK